MDSQKAPYQGQIAPMNEKLAALYALQQLDTALLALKKQYAALDKGDAQRAAFETAKSAHVAAEQALHATSASLHDAELEQKAVEAKRKDEETRLYSGRVQAAKELQALQEEIEMLGRQRVKLDEKILTLMDELTTHQHAEASTREVRAAAEAVLNAQLARYKLEGETIVAQAREIAGQRNVSASQVDAALLKRYEAMRVSKGGLAIVALEDGNACGGCKMALPSSFVEQTKSGGEIMMCQNCGRVVYYPRANA